jgi:hypothetical protein
MKFGVAYSILDDSYQAARKAAEEAVEVSGRPALTFVFTTDSYDQRVVLETVKGVVGNSKIVGFCGAGIISGEDILRQGLAVGTVSDTGIGVATSLQAGIGKDSYGAGHRAGEELLASGINEGAVIVLPDGVTGNTCEVLRGLYNAMGPDFTYIGGGSGRNIKSSKTYQFTEAGVKSDALAVALLDGPSIHTNIMHGWKPVGSPLVITKSQEKTVYKIDGSPAFDAYSEQLDGVTMDNFVEFSRRHPLGIPDVSGNYLIRDPRAVNDDKSINFTGEIPENLVANIMEGAPKAQVESLKSMFGMITESVTDPMFALVFDCNSRSFLLGDDFKEELRLISKNISSQVPTLGALTFGEIGSYGDVPMFHNKTLAIATLYNK